MRVLTGSFRLLLGLAILGSVAWQVTDRIANHVFRPQEYFTFFTVDTSILVGLVLLIGAYLSFNGKVESRLFTMTRLGLVTSYVIVGVVYNLLLRGLPPAAADAGYVWPETPNNVLHVWAPLLLVVEWLVFELRHRISLKQALWVWAYPFAWLAFT
ncbi:MAG: Pr6Pr family membrane protein, partial [Actinomycetales bacterium]|nr:Pr6Pr family membrane protein [Actinomycetales bacterium]